MYQSFLLIICTLLCCTDLVTGFMVHRSVALFQKSTTNNVVLFATKKPVTPKQPEAVAAPAAAEAKKATKDVLSKGDLVNLIAAKTGFTKTGN